MTDIEKGLTTAQAGEKLKQFGKNVIKRKKAFNPFKLLLAQFSSPLILTLFAAAIISLFVSFLPGQEANLIDPILISLIVVVSGFSGFFQDYQAEKTIESLQKMMVVKAKVIRDGEEVEIDARNIVPGDIILIDEGDKIPADAKILKDHSLSLDESSLTGESNPVNKKTGDLIFMNSLTYAGRAKALVMATGSQTKMGQIASKLESIKDEKTPFQNEISTFSKKIIIATLLIALIILIIGAFKFSFIESLLISIALAVAAIPEGLPAIVVLTLAIGAKVMSGKNGLIRKLSVVESIGAVDVICTDKTGTLTKNEMTVKNIYSQNESFSSSKINTADIKNLMLCFILCNNSKRHTKDGQTTYTGDPTETALKRLAFENDFFQKMEAGKYLRVDEIPFSSQKKYMSVICKRDKSFYVFTKGAPEVVLSKCTSIYKNDKTVKLSETDKKIILRQNEKYASSALRVLGFAYKPSKSQKTSLDKNLVWLGLAALVDPPRKEVKEALNDAESAGIKVIMLTGDSPLTAKSVAEELGLKSNSIVTGVDMTEMTEKELEEKINSGVRIFARVSPFDKLKILESLKKNYRVAMTGDGVNDALALKKADVGISMGIHGTQVAREASDIILLDDNFATIETAVREGRRTFDNIRKVINYLFVSNFAEVAVIFIATLFLKIKTPILFPVQLLWINLLTDGLPALALGIDPPRKDIMKRPPREKGEPLINKRLWYLIGTIGVKKTLILFIMFLILLPKGLDVARTALFTGFILYEFVRIGSIRATEKLNWLSNKWLIGAVGFSLILQVIVIYSPLNTFFHITILGFYEWSVLIIGAAIGYALAILITKIVVLYIKQ